MLNSVSSVLAEVYNVVNNSKIMSIHFKQQWTDSQNVQVNKYMLLNINNVSHTIHILTTRSQRKIVIWDMFECVDHPWCVWIIHHVGHPQCESSTVWVIHTLCKCVDHSNMYDPHFPQVCGSFKYVWSTLSTSVWIMHIMNECWMIQVLFKQWIIHMLFRYVDYPHYVQACRSSIHYWIIWVIFWVCELSLLQTW